jgi:hypothetical protein
VVTTCGTRPWRERLEARERPVLVARLKAGAQGLVERQLPRVERAEDLPALLLTVDPERVVRVTTLPWRFPQRDPRSRRATLDFLAERLTDSGTIALGLVLGTAGREPAGPLPRWAEAHGITSPAVVVHVSDGQTRETAGAELVAGEEGLGLGRWREGEPMADDFARLERTLADWRPPTRRLRLADWSAGFSPR